MSVQLDIDKPKHAGGRPPVFNQDDIIRQFTEFINVNEDPLVVEFCANYGISSTRFYEIARINEQLASTLKRATDKCEGYLVRNAQNNKINPIFAMFRLKQKQFGWSDKQEIEITGPNGGPILTQSLNTLQLDDLLKLEEIMSKALPEVIDITPEEG